MEKQSQWGSDSIEIMKEGHPQTSDQITLAESIAMTGIKIDTKESIKEMIEQYKEKQKNLGNLWAVLHTKKAEAIDETEKASIEAEYASTEKDLNEVNKIVEDLEKHTYTKAEDPETLN